MKIPQSIKILSVITRCFLFIFLTFPSLILCIPLFLFLSQPIYICYKRIHSFIHSLSALLLLICQFSALPFSLSFVESAKRDSLLRNFRLNASVNTDFTQSSFKRKEVIFSKCFFPNLPLSFSFSFLFFLKLYLFSRQNHLFSASISSIRNF